MNIQIKRIILFQNTFTGKTVFLILLFVGITLALTAENTERKVIMSDVWTVSESIFTPGPAGAFDAIAVKDPSIVYHKGRYHMFYTSKPHKEEGVYETGLGYVAAATLEELNTAPRTLFKEVVEEDVIAVQVFYFEPHRLWYLIGHIDLGKAHKLQPVYLVNPDIEDVKGWSKPKAFMKERAGSNPFWIDFWIICDKTKAHLFYTDHTHRMFRIESPLEDFPDGFNPEKKEIAASAQGEDDIGPWHLHEASHIYRVKEDGRYLALLEGAYSHPTRKNYWDSRNRFMFAMTADQLEGPWTRMEPTDNKFLADAPQLRDKEGNPVALNQVSHPELIRSGYDQYLEIDNYKLKMVFQAFDASRTPDNFDYDFLPWALWLAQN